MDNTTDVEPAASPEPRVPAPQSGIPLSTALLAVLGGFLLYTFVSELLETTLVRAVTSQPITDVASYFAIRNSSTVLAAKIVYNALSAVLAGYMTARLAGSAEPRYAGIVAIILTARLGWSFTMGAYASFTPVWMQWMMLLTTAPAIMLGAFVRAKARATETEST